MDLNNNNNTSIVDIFPEHIWTHVFDSIAHDCCVTELLRLRLTCKIWRREIEKDNIWNVICKRFGVRATTVAPKKMIAMATHLCWRMVKAMLETSDTNCKMLFAALPRIGSRDAPVNSEFADKLNSIIRTLDSNYVPSDRSRAIVEGLMSVLGISFLSYHAPNNQEWVYHNRKRPDNTKEYPKGWIVQVLKTKLESKLPIMFGSNAKLTLRVQLVKTLELFLREHLHQEAAMIMSTNPPSPPPLEMDTDKHTQDSKKQKSTEVTVAKYHSL